MVFASGDNEFGLNNVAPITIRVNKYKPRYIKPFIKATSKKPEIIKNKLKP